MKPVTKKILESGLIDKHVAAMLARWGTIELEGLTLPNDEEQKKLQTREQLEQFAEDLEALMDQESEAMRETPLDLPVGPVESFSLPSHHILFNGRWDAMGRLVVDAHIRVRRGEQINCVAEGKFYRALDVTTLYKDEEAHSRLITVEDW